MAGPRWVKLDTGYLRNPKLASLSTDAILLHVASITFCVHHLTDGAIPESSLRDLGQMARIDVRWVRRRALELEALRLWVPNGDGWSLHDFLAMNPQAERKVVETERERNRERQRRFRERRNGVTGEE